MMEVTKTYHHTLFTKSKNLELLENIKKWYGFKYEIVYFYNVYGPRQVSKGKMATVIGIFEEHYKKNKTLPVVKPGTQTRRFTISMIQLILVLTHGKKINVNIIVFRTKRVSLLKMLLKCLVPKLNFYPVDLGKGMPLL